MKERRQYERFILPLPVRLEPITTGRKRVLDLETRDISASGTFINTLTSFPEGTRFILDFTIPSDSIEEFVREEFEGLHRKHSTFNLKRNGDSF